MNSAGPNLTAAQAARRLGISVKALRLYEEHGLIAPGRTAAGWRVYGPDHMARSGEIVALRGLGLSLAQVAEVLQGDPTCLAPVLAAHQADIESEIRTLAGRLEKVRAIRSEIEAGRAPSIRQLAELAQPESAPALSIDLPWPWGGERFELSRIKPINYIIGPLGSGKTRLAHAIAAALPGAAFLGLDRLDDDAAAMCKLNGTPEHERRVTDALEGLIANGATRSPALVSLVTALEADTASILVIDMVEQGLDRASQEAVAVYLRRRPPGAPRLFILTRSSAIIDLNQITPDEAIILCPANHSPPIHVVPYPGAPGYEAVATCLAPPEVRARMAGMIAWLPGAA